MSPVEDNEDHDPLEIHKRQKLWMQLQENPKDFRANLEMGVYCASRRKFVLFAEPYLLKALTLRSSDKCLTEILSLLARVADAKGDLERSAEILSTLENLNPDDWNLSLDVATTYHFLGQIDTTSTKASRVLDRLDSHAKSVAGNHTPRRLLWPVSQVIEHFGELVYAVDFRTKLQRLGWSETMELVLLAPPDKIVNRCLLDYCRPFVTVVEDPQEVEVLRQDLMPSALPVHFARLPDGRVAYFHISYISASAEWERQGRAPLFQLTEAHKARGQAALKELGIPENSWFVAFHARDLKTKEEESFWPSERFRVTPLEDYIPAMKSIASRGGYIVRLGDPKTDSMPDLPNAIDYPRSALKSDWMDIFLIASCRFMIGGASGPSDVARGFGVPLVAANWFPPGLWPPLSNNIFVPKILVHSESGRELTIREAVSAPFTHPNAFVFERKGVTVKNSAPDDIVDAVNEMIDWLDGNDTPSEEDIQLQTEFWKAADPFDLGFRSRVSRSFLKKHPELLG